MSTNFALNFTTLLLATLLLAGPLSACPVDERHFRLPLEIEAAEHKRVDQPVELEVDFVALFGKLGPPGTFSADYLRVVEVDADGKTLDDKVPFQFDADSKVTPSRGTLVFLLVGETAAKATRRYRVSFDLNAGRFFRFQWSPPRPTSRVLVTDAVDHAGQESYKIETRDPKEKPVATYYYHKEGSGFASMIDRDGHDWIAYSTAKGDQGVWRGIPNMGWDKLDEDPGFGHPGYETGTSEILQSGPLKVTIRSRSKNSKWECLWEIYPGLARLTIERVPPGRKYWFLYEGTPGGLLKDDDVCVRGSGERTPLSESWAGDLAVPEWLYFSSLEHGRSLFLVHVDGDEHEDSYYKLRTMTVLGFGRGSGKKQLDNKLTATPNRFLIGFAESTLHADIAQVVASALHPPRVVVGKPEVLSP